MLKRIFITAFALGFCLAAFADTVEVVEVIEEVECVVLDSVAPDNSASSRMPSSWLPKPKHGPRGLRFAWGAEVGSTIDMSGHEMSSIDFNASAGLSYDWLSFAGIGVGANIMLNNSCRTYPIYVDLRSDFSNLIKVLFVDFRAGLALNYLENDSRQTGAYLSPSIGFNLATGATFRSYITVGYTYISRKDAIYNGETIPHPSLSMATVRLGIAF